MKNRMLALILAALLIVLSACSSGGNNVSRAYDEALNAMVQGKYTEAVNKLAGISFYQDSAQLSLYCRAHAKAAEGDYDYAIEELRKLGSYRDSEKCAVYFSARKAEDTADAPVSRAYAAWLFDREEINGFRDSAARAASIRSKMYDEGLKAQEEEAWSDASALFEALEDYQDSRTRYHYATGRMCEADDKGISYAKAVRYYDRVSDYLDSADRKEQCLTAAYSEADRLIAAGDFDGTEAIYMTLDDLCDKGKYAELQDAREKAAEAARQKRIAEADALLEENRYDEAREIYLEVSEPEKATEALYLKAAYLAETGDAESAAAQYLSISDYKDSREKHFVLGDSLKETDPETARRILLSDREYPGAEDVLYDIALKATEAENYALSISIYSEFVGKQDCTLRMKNDLYLYGLKLLREENPEKAAVMFDQLKGVGSAGLHANMARYAAAEALEAKGSFEAAAAAFDVIAGYEDASARADDCRYQLAAEKKKNGQYLEAADLFAALGDLEDCAEQERNCRYLHAAEKKENGQYLEAAELFAALGDLEDSAEQEKDCRYLQAGVYAEQNRWEDAIKLYEDLNDYAESRTRCAECYKQLGERQLADGEAEKAYRSFAAAGDADGQARAAFAVGEILTAKMSLNEALKWYSLAPELPETEERTAMIARSLLNMEEDALSEQYASVVSDSEKAKNVLYALALRSLERKDEEAAMRQMKKAGGNADASERFKAMLNERVEALISEGKYDDAIFLCTNYGEKERADEVRKAKAEKELEAEKAERERIRAREEEAAALLAAGSYDEALGIYRELNNPEMINEVIYQKAAALNEPGLYMGILDYRDSREQHYLAGKALLDSDPEKAFRILAEDLSYPDVKTVLYDLADRESKAEHYLLSSEIFGKLEELPLDPAAPMPDCHMRRVQDLYRYGLQLQGRNDWKEAADVFGQMSGVGKAQAHAQESLYAVAAVLEENGEYTQAAVAFEELGKYSDARKRAKQNRYNAAKKQMDSGSLESAAAAFAELGNYSDAPHMANECRYRVACNKMEAGKYTEAGDLFAKLGSFSDSADKEKECRYRVACNHMEAGRYTEARDRFEKLGTFSDSADKKKECIYQIAEQYLGKLRYNDAISAYETVRDYRDAAEKLNTCHAALGDQWIQKAEALLKNGNEGQAAKAYESAYQEYAADEAKREELALRIADCYVIDDVNASLDWYRKAGGTGKQRLLMIIDYCIATEQYEAAEYLVKDLNTDEGKARLYQIGEIMLAEGNEEEALRLFADAGGYSNAKDKHDEILYQNAERLIAEKRYLDAADIFDRIPDYQDAGERKMGALYSYAQQLVEQGSYLDAVDIFDRIPDYKDAGERKMEALYSYGQKLVEQGAYPDAANIFSKILDYKDAGERKMGALYSYAQQLAERGSYITALSVFESIRDYSDSENKITELKSKMMKAGDVVRFGRYEQDNNLDNGAEVIEWNVLEVRGEKALLLSRYGLETKPYNTGKGNFTWEKCSLRIWLNREFLPTAFSEEEQNTILTTEVDNSAWQGFSRWNTVGGNNTQDRVFLLSFAEAKQYLKVVDPYTYSIEACAAPTAYAIAHGAWIDEKSMLSDGRQAAYWWLRSPGLHQNEAADVSSTGSLIYDSIDIALVVVRPALWIDLKSGGFEVELR